MMCLCSLMNVTTLRKILYFLIIKKYFSRSLRHPPSIRVVCTLLDMPRSLYNEFYRRI